MSQCTEVCRKPVDCHVCKKRKKPIGRDAPMAMANSLCDHECPGYRDNPYPPHLWPNEDIGDEDEP